MKTSLSQLTKRQSDWTSDRKTKNNTSYFKKGIHTIQLTASLLDMQQQHNAYRRENQKNFQNSETVISIENNARNNIKYTLDGVFDFMNFRHKDMAPQYKVLKSYL
jgi:hypothetical protein